MKKKTVITTEKLEVWFIPQSSDAPPGAAPAPETDSCESESSNQSLMPVPEEQPDKDVPPTHED